MTFCGEHKHVGCKQKEEPVLDAGAFVPTPEAILPVPQLFQFPFATLDLQATVENMAMVNATTVKAVNTATSFAHADSSTS